MPLLLGKGSFGAVDRVARDLEIDERIQRKGQVQCAATGDATDGQGLVQRVTRPGSGLNDRSFAVRFTLPVEVAVWEFA